MKKTISLFLALIMCLLLVACGNGGSVSKTTVDKKLQGVWQSQGNGGSLAFMFEDGAFAAQLQIGASALNMGSGTYEIGENKIVLNYEDGDVGELEYTFKNGELILADGDYVKES